MLQITRIIISLLLAVINRNAFVENEPRALATRATYMDQQTDVQNATLAGFTKLNEAIKGGAPKGGTGQGKPISEFKALQNLRTFSGDRAELRQWSDKLLNALVHVKRDYRKAVGSSTRS